MSIDGYLMRMRDPSLPVCGGALPRMMVDRVLDIVSARASPINHQPQVTLFTDRALVSLVPMRVDEINRVTHNAKVECTLVVSCALLSLLPHDCVRLRSRPVDVWWRRFTCRA